MTKYEWKDGFSKIPVEQVVEQFDKVATLYGGLTADNVLKEAAKTDSILHQFFEWDNDMAANKYRLQQARNLINRVEIVVIKDGQPRQVGAFEIVHVGENRVYKNVGILTKDEVSEVRKAVLGELAYLKDKLSFFSELKPAIKHLEKAEKSLR